MSYIKGMLRKWFLYNETALRSRAFWGTWVSSLLLLAATLAVNYFTGLYATHQASNAVTDIILSNTRAYNVDLIFVNGAFIFWVGIAILLFVDMRLGPFVLKSISLFILIRSFFISLTHIGPFPERMAVDAGVVFSKVTFGGDLFFSGHAGLPFLLALLFWKNKGLRYTCLITSVALGVSALLGHRHYSIDVFAAYFITYTIWHIAQAAFSSDLRLFQESPLAGKS